MASSSAVRYEEDLGRTSSGLRVVRVRLPKPAMGAKCYLVERKGIYVLEAGEGVFRSLSCTHVGSGSVHIHDGLPDENGYFGNERMDPYSKEYMSANGRKLYAAVPQVMCFWMLDAGFRRGLTVVASGGAPDSVVFLSISWISAND